MYSNAVVVTGAHGFIGSSVVHALDLRGYRVIQAAKKQALNGTTLSQPDFNYLFSSAGAQSVIHLAGRAHIMSETSKNPLAEYRIANYDMTVNLARAAAKNGVKRFIYISSLGVHGRLSNSPITEESPYDPHSDYAISKCEAEIGLLNACKETGLETVIIRPPLVYGPGVRANFFSLLKAIYRGIPLPFSNIKNKRSLISLENLTNFIVHCLESDKSAGETFLISDDSDISTKELVYKLAHFMGRPARLFPCPPQALIRAIGRISGRSAAFDGVFGTLQVDIGKARNLLGWTPPQSTDDGLQSVAHWYLEQYGAQP